MRARRDDIAAVLLTRTTQTNIPARCATLLPALAALPPPLALVEVGASAGLCLHPDRYSYDYDGHRVTPSRASGVPPFRCAADPNTPLPGAPVEVAWRAGLDLHPLDVDDPTTPTTSPGSTPSCGPARTTCGRSCTPRSTWRASSRCPCGPVTRPWTFPPCSPRRRATPPSSSSTARCSPTSFPYVTDAGRRAFVDAVRSSRAVWLANESPAWIPGIDPTTVAGHPAGQVLLCGDGRPLARADPHASWIDWL